MIREITIQSLTAVLLVALLIAPALTESLVRHCGADIQVRFSADSGSTQEISCCMQNPSQCRWASQRHPQVNASYREEQTGLILSLQPGIDLFGLYNCFNQTNGTEKQINFLPMEGDKCPSCLSVSACATSTEIKLYITMIWFSASLIHPSCELHRNGELLQSIDLDNCVQMRREEFDSDIYNFTVVCPIKCDGCYRIQHDIPRSSFTNMSDCLTDENCITPSSTGTASSTELLSLASQSESYGTISTAPVALTTVSSLPTPLRTPDGSTSDDIEIGIIVGAGVGGVILVIIVIIVISFIFIQCSRNACITSTTKQSVTGPGDGARNEIEMTDTPINEDEQIGNPPPTFTIHPENKVVYLSEPETVSFTCQADNTTSYQWKKEDGSVPSDARGINSNTLSFENLQPAYDGKYHCVATNDSGSSVSYSATFTICDNTGELLVNNNSENKDLLPIILSLHKDMERYIDMKELYGTLNTYGLLVRNEREHLNPAGPSVKSPTEKINYFLLCLENKTQRELEGFLKALYSTAHVGGHNNLIKLLQGKGITIERNSTV